MKLAVAVLLGCVYTFAQPGAEPEYKKLREAQAIEAFTVEAVSLRRDVGVFQLKSGTITFGPAILNKVTMAVFTGEGEFVLAPAVPYERDYIHSLTGEDSIRETFDRAVFYFTDNSYTEIKGKTKPGTAPTNVADILKDFRQKARKPDNLSNLEAGLLADLYNPKRGVTFTAMLHGRKYEDLRFGIFPRGVHPQLGNEEVILNNVHPTTGAIMYLAHRVFEYTNGVAPMEDRRSFEAQDYKITTSIARNERLSATAEVRVRAVNDGDRVVTLGLVPELRVSSARMGDAVLPFIQEDSKQDGELSVVLPTPAVKGQSYTLSMEYAGDKVVHNEGGGNFSVGARESWYPSLNSFVDQATYEISFRVPRRYQLVSVGKKISETVDGDFAISTWKSEVPIAVAGFNYGEFKRQEVKFEPFPYVVEGYATSGLPDYLKRAGDEVSGMSPVRLLDKSLQETRASLELFSKWFGPPPYGRIAVTQQPQMDFGQSWPGLVYLPMLSFFDSTQRLQLFGGISSGINDFVQEVTPHEVSHQWWGHMVGFQSYRDQWISEGFADFSAGLYLQQTNQPAKYLKFLEGWRDTILAKNNYGRTANEAGPLAMGWRLNSEKNPIAYNRLVYPKGGFVLHMLRAMMFDPEKGDERFIAMMHDFVQSHLYKPASTASFQAVAEKHNGGKLDWFFNQWVWGTDIPHYKLDYTVADVAGGKFKLTGTIAQSGVSDTFRMPVPVYADFDGRIVRILNAPLIGNGTYKLDLELPRKPRRVMINANFDVLAYK